MLKHLALAALVTVPTMGHAQDRNFVRERVTLPVNTIDANSFEVIEDDGAAGTQIWCAAGLYTRKALGQRGGDLYIEVARGPAQTAPGRKGVVFTTEPVAGAFNSVSQGVKRAGQTFSMSHAYALCRSNRAQSVRVRTEDGRLLRR
ncbi:hypothetical protein [uncultured Tateyamaria sp.]|uniref:hypothetical protein n=1 Tax=uncultured Tateyamaria sp. TaxID=455651 RepID=UPI00262ECB72|nr:hypothetical protein [uncultured Tateyamaria sp.]